MIIIKKLFLLIRWCIGLVLVTFGFLCLGEFTIAALLFLAVGLFLLYYVDIKQTVGRLIRQQ